MLFRQAHTPIVTQTIDQVGAFLHRPLHCGTMNFMIIEMRTYKTKPGQRTRFLEIFRSQSIPAHLEIGMKILGPFLSVEDPDTFFFMRGFPDLGSREPMKARFYEGALWKNELENVLMPMLEKYEAVVVEDVEGLIPW
jgi:hypothetical protein